VGLSQADIERVRLQLLEAAQDPEAWPLALGAYAEACGGYAGQLIARDGQNQPLFHLVTHVDPALLVIGEASGLGDLAANPRLRIGQRAPLLEPRVDTAFVDPVTRSRSRTYAEFFDRYDLAFNCQTVLHRSGDLLVRASVSRTRSKGPFEDDDIEVFAALAPYLQAALRQQLLSEQRALEGVLQAAEATDAVLLVLSRSGRVLAASNAAAKVLVRDAPFTVVAGRLRFAPGGGTAGLQAAIGRALDAWAGWPFPEPETVVADAAGRRFALRVTTLKPKAFSVAAEPAVLICSVVPTAASNRMKLIESLDLTPAEASTAEFLAMGLAPKEIAGKRGRVHHHGPYPDPSHLRQGGRAASRRTDGSP